MSQTYTELASKALSGHLASHLEHALGKPSSFDFEWMKQDGSSRRYLRIKDVFSSQSFVVMLLGEADTQKLASSSYEWLAIRQILSEKDVLCPKVIACLPESGAIVLEDLGPIHMCDFISNQEIKKESSEQKHKIEAIFDNCFQMIEKFLSIDPCSLDGWSHRSFTTQQFVQELFFFEEHILRQEKDHWLTAHQKEQFEKEVHSLSSFLSAQSHYFVHRDFHSKNLMVQKEQLWVLDFQDARLGPAAYDLVSLCFDSYLKIPNKQRIQLMEKGITSIRALVDACEQELLENFWQAMLLQRQLKAIGSFGFLTKTKAQDYLSNAPRALLTIKETIKERPLKKWPFLSKELISILEEKRMFS